MTFALILASRTAATHLATPWAPRRDRAVPACVSARSTRACARRASTTRSRSTCSVLRGKLPGDWTWEAFASEGRTVIDQFQSGNIDTDKLLGPAGRR